MKNMLLHLLLIHSCTYITHGQNIMAPDFTLTNQFGQESSFSFPNNKKTILVFADRNSGKQTKAWTQQLRADFGNEIEIVGIAVMGWVPFFVKNSVKESFLKKAPILLDWGDDVADEYNYKSDNCLVVYIAPDGMVKISKHGEFSEKEYAGLKNAVQHR
jgi:AhpC/TSA family